MYVFYDFETSGLNPAFEQVLQFAAIYTDDSFNEIEIVNERCKLRKDIIPSPAAMAITGMTPDAIIDSSLPTEYQFSHKMSKLIEKWSPSVFAGYNTLSFDEEFFRHAFYQNLHPNIYQTQFDGNTRFDVLNLVAAASVLAPDAITFPINAKGNQSLKLEDIAAANGFEGHHAHDALGDVRATIFMAALIRERAPDVWKFMNSNIDKHHVAKTINSTRPLFLIESNFGKRTIYPICYAGKHPKNPNEYAVVDLGKEGTAALLSASDDEIDNALCGSPKLIRRIKINANPMIFSCDQFTEFTMDDEYFRLTDTITQDSEFQEKVSAALQRRTDAFEIYPYYEQRIYDGFPSSHDKAILAQIASATKQDKAAIIETIECPRLKYLGRKLIWLYAPELLSPEVAEEIELDIQARRQSNLTSKDRELTWTSFQKVAEEMEKVENTQMMSDATIELWKQFYSDTYGLEF